MNDKKITFYIILILLIIFVPLAGIGTVLHFKNKTPKVENENHEFYHDGKLYFYKKEELLGTYTCENKEGYCDYAIAKNKKEYFVNEYEPEATPITTIIEDRYVFLMDTQTENLQQAEILLYDIENSRTIGKYKEVKNYAIGIENNNYIVKNSQDLWGVIQFYDGINLKIPFQYDYIALPNRVNFASDLIYADAFAVLKEGTWQIIDINQKELTNALKENIFTFNNESIVLEENGNMRLVDYKGGNRLLETYKYINFYSKYIGIIDHNNEFYLYDLASGNLISNRHKVNDAKEVEVEIVGATIQIKIAKNLVESIAIS